MATTATKFSPSALDIRTPATLPIRLGPSILDPSSALTTVRYNHKPALGPRNPSASISHGAADGATQLSFTAGGGKEFVYSGLEGVLSDTYVLLPHGREMLLERLSTAHAFNLIRGPVGQDGKPVTDQYAQITLSGEDEETGDGGEGDLFGEEDGEEADVDPANPFDWRHWLRKRGAQPEEQPPRAADRKIERRVAPNPAATKKRKQPPAKEKSAPKRVKAGEAGAAPKAKPQRASKPAPPEIRLDRKASIRTSTVDAADDSGELILEDDGAGPPAARPSAMGLALSGHFGDGPKSLRSVASSPAASRLASTSPRPGALDDGEEIDLDPGSDAGDEDEDDPTAAQAVTTYHFDDFDGDDDEADADVEDLDLPSPAQAHKPSVSAATVTSAAAPPDDDVDLGEALALALGENDDEGGPAPVHESDEESEEE
nr:hypothetical protein CFP56_03990 [Quercus suber]